MQVVRGPDGREWRIWREINLYERDDGFDTSTGEGPSSLILPVIISLVLLFMVAIAPSGVILPMKILVVVFALAPLVAWWENCPRRVNAACGSEHWYYDMRGLRKACKYERMIVESVRDTSQPIGLDRVH